MVERVRVRVGQVEWGRILIFWCEHPVSNPHTKTLSHKAQPLGNGHTHVRMYVLGTHILVAHIHGSFEFISSPFIIHSCVLLLEPCS